MNQHLILIPFLNFLKITKITKIDGIRDRLQEVGQF